MLTTLLLVVVTAAADAGASSPTPSSVTAPTSASTSTNAAKTAAPTAPTSGPTATTASTATTAAATPSADGGANAEADEDAVLHCAPGKAVDEVKAGRVVTHTKGEEAADEAIKHYQAALAADPKCEAALWEMGWCQQSRNDWDAAIATWDQLKTLDADYPELSTQYPIAVQRREKVQSLATLPKLGKLKPRDTKPAEGERITLGAVGDVNMGRGWPENRKALPDQPEHLFDGIKEALQSPDVTLGNLETVLADSGESTKCSKHSNNCFAFRVPTEYAKILKDVGFDTLSVANNHAGDFGPLGRKSTIAALDAVGIGHSGPVGDIATWETKGRKFALIGLSFGSADVYRIQDIETDQRLIAQLKKDHDIVIVFFHAGAEGKGYDHVKKGVEHFLGENRGDSIAFAHAAIDAGADLALGSGPHLMRALELYQGRLIAYSLGNFSTWETFGLNPPNNITGVLNVTLAPNGVATEIKVVPGIIEKPGKPMVDSQKLAIERLRKLSKEDFGKPILDQDGHWSLGSK
jgi:hypothetical protein